MREEDLYAFLRADLSIFPPRVGRPTFFATAALRASLAQARRRAPKAASEGSEVTLTWPSWVPTRTGHFEELDDRGRIVYRRDDGRRIAYWQWQRWQEPRFAYLGPGDPIAAGETIVAGVVEPPRELGCAGETWNLDAAMAAAESTERYAAVKVAGVTGRLDLEQELAIIARDDKEDWRISLEAHASLARLQPDWTDRIAAVARDPDAQPEQRMEAVFVLSEIPTDEAVGELATIATPDPKRSADLRAAAAWGLGQGVAPRPELLLELTADEDTFVGLHAIAAIQDLPDHLVSGLLEWMAGADDHRAAVAAQLLQRHERVGPLLDACERNTRARLWALRALGDLPPVLVRREAGSRLTNDLEASLEPMWLGQTDWLRRDGREGLEALDVQKVRSNPNLPGPV